MSEKITALLEVYPYLQEWVWYLMKKSKDPRATGKDREDAKSLLKEVRLLALRANDKSSAEDPFPRLQKWILFFLTKCNSPAVEANERIVAEKILKDLRSLLLSAQSKTRARRVA